MKQSFSKGKWSLCPHQRRNAAYDIWTDFDNQKPVPVCLAVIQNRNIDSSDEVTANARLIAHAPDMYDLLYEVMYELKQYETKLTYKKTYWELIQELLAQIDGEEAKA